MFVCPKHHQLLLISLEANLWDHSGYGDEINRSEDFPSVFRTCLSSFLTSRLFSDFDKQLSFLSQRRDEQFFFRNGLETDFSSTWPTVVEDFQFSRLTSRDAHVLL